MLGAGLLQRAWMKAITDRSWAGVSSCSSPSGISDVDSIRRSAISPRGTVICFASG